MSMFLRKMKHSLYLSLMGVAVKFSPPVRHQVFIGSGSSANICRHIAQTGLRKVLVVTDKPLRQLGVVDSAIAGLFEAGVDVAIYDGVKPDPTFDQVAEGVAAYRAHGSGHTNSQCKH